MKKLIPYMNKYKLYAFLSPLFMIFEVGTDIIIPYLMAKIIDVGIKNVDMDYIVKVGLVMILLAVLGMIFGALSAHFGARAGYGFASEVRLETFKRVQAFSFANLDGFSVSSLITRLTNDVTRLGQVTMMSLRMGIRAPLMMIFSLGMAFNINTKLAFVFGVSIPLTIGLMGYVLVKARPLFLEIQTRVDRVNSVIKENLAGMGVVKSFNRQKHEEKRFKVRNDEFRDMSLKAIGILIILMPAFDLIIYATIVAVLWFSSNQLVTGLLGQGDLIAFITYIRQVLMSLIMVGMFFMRLLSGIASKERILEVWDTTSEIKQPKNPIYKINDGSIEFRGVNFCYFKDGEKVLKDVNLNIKSGQTIGIIGSTGSSKSTLVQLIPRLYDVKSGSVLVGGNNVKDYDLVTLRDQVAFVLQQNTLFSGTIRDNMLWGNENASDEEIISALKSAAAWEFVSEYDDTLDHIVEQGGNNYSGGQKQRLTIARALLKNPKIIILDDSTSAVDMSTDAKIQSEFKKNLAGVTTIIIAQRISSIQHADQIIVMHEGEIESVDTHENLINKSVIYREIFESQAKGVISE